MMGICCRCSRLKRNSKYDTDDLRDSEIKYKRVRFRNGTRSMAETFTQRHRRQPSIVHARLDGFSGVVPGTVSDAGQR